MDRLPEWQKKRAHFFQGSLTYRDARFADHDAIVLMEVIEHVDPERLPFVGQVIFGEARPRTVIVTTPNSEYNRQYNLPEGKLRHPDHRFEWNRAEFSGWCEHIAARHGYTVQYVFIGEEHEEYGAPTQTGVFTLCE
jgi:hypothetical protein